MITFKLGKLVCNIFGKHNEDSRRDTVLDYIEQLLVDIEIKDKLIMINQILAWLIDYVGADYGFINRTHINGVITYRPLAMYGLSLNEKTYHRKFYNIPLKQGNKFLGFVGFGGKKLKMNHIKHIDPLLGFIRDLLWANPELGNSQKVTE